MMKGYKILLVLLCLCMGATAKETIDRQSLVMRNCPVVHAVDTLESLSVGNGRFAVTVDATGMQTFPEHYSNGMALGTQSEWGWHSFPNTQNLRPEEYLKAYDFGHKSKKELYACQFKEAGRQHDASEYFRINPHRLHLGVVGFDMKKTDVADVKEVYQMLNLWRGEINTSFAFHGQRYDVHTVCHPDRDMVGYDVSVASVNERLMPLVLRLPYPTGKHVDDGCDFRSDDKHVSEIVETAANHCVVRHTIDDTTYYVILRWNGKASVERKAAHVYCLVPAGRQLSLTAEFVKEKPTAAVAAVSYDAVAEASARHWQQFWTEGAAVDFSHCRDARARELERRVVLSQYLLAIQCAGNMPPQETGLTMNSWFGKFHLEMILWHQAWLPLWGHPEMLTRSLQWYHQAEPIARQIAARQGFDGLRWMKMTDPSAMEAPSNVGSFLIWQQPHVIYLTALACRSLPKERVQAWLPTMLPLIDGTAQFMCSFANYDKKTKRYILKGMIPAQESLKASITRNSPFELSQWRTTLLMAQQLREQCGQKRMPLWDKVAQNLSPLAFNADSLYLAAESATDTYTNLKATSDHPALLGALGFFPMSDLINERVMDKTLDWITQNWNWPTSWGWDFPMTAMTATRMLQPEKAINSLLLPMQKNTYLGNGHNYQDARLRLYLPGNGALLSAVALMCAGWDGCNVKNPGFPKDGNWDVRWEGLTPMP